ncbi:MAG TPA: hypothetical protein VGQ97_06770, partial [Xanthobacteraceae bacterium]|nr:hypothetical protein [Xanthobacteraceae bacterium]
MTTGASIEQDSLERAQGIYSRETRNAIPLVTFSVAPWRLGSFIATFDGRELCRSRRPLLSAARIFLRDGFPETTRLALIHTGSAT